MAGILGIRVTSKIILLLSEPTTKGWYILPSTKLIFGLYKYKPSESCNIGASLPFKAGVGTLPSSASDFAAVLRRIPLLLRLLSLRLRVAGRDRKGVGWGKDDG